MAGELGTTCLVALDAAAPIVPGTLRRSFPLIAPRSSLIMTAADEPDTEQAMLIEVDGHRFGAALFDMPMPGHSFQEATERSLFWPEAAQAMADHRAFLAIGAAERSPITGLARAAAVALTRLVAALVRDLPVSGILWQSAGTCCAPDRVARAAAEIEHGKSPIDIWLGWQHFRPPDSPASVLGLQTVGAQDYLGYELEIPPAIVLDPKEPLRILFNAAGHLMSHQGKIVQGQVIEVSGERSAIAQILDGEDGKPTIARLTLQPIEQRSAG